MLLNKINIVPVTKKVFEQVDLIDGNLQRLINKDRDYGNSAEISMLTTELDILHTYLSIDEIRSILTTLNFTYECLNAAEKVIIENGHQLPFLHRVDISKMSEKAIKVNNIKNHFINLNKLYYNNIEIERKTAVGTYKYISIDESKIKIKNNITYVLVDDGLMDIIHHLTLPTNGNRINNRIGVRLSFKLFLDVYTHLDDVAFNHNNINKEFITLTQYYLGLNK